MSLDIRKFKKILQKFDISIIEYYSIDKKCAMIKAFIDSICEFLIIYIPSKIRFEIETQNIYEIVEIEDKTDNDDYSNSSKVPNMQRIDEEKSLSKYDEMTKKYKTNISLDGSDEPIPRKIKRQINRLKIPFSSLDYDIGISHNKYMGISFGDSTSIYHIKNYKGTSRNIMYFINVNNLIQKIDDVKDNINSIKKQFYDIIQTISISNFNSINDTKLVSVPSIVSITLKKEEYKKSIQDYENIYMKIKEKQDNIISEYNKISSQDDVIKVKAVSTKYQKELNDVFYSKTDIIKKGMILVGKYQKSLLILEEVSFDNSIMIDRVAKNFEQLKELL